MTAATERPLRAAPDDERPEPHDLNAERAVLGAATLAPDLIPQLAGILRDDDWYRPAHQLIWHALTDLHATSQPVDPIALAHHLQTRNELNRVGGALYLHGLLENLPAASSATYYARIVAEHAQARRTAEFGTWVAQAATSGTDPDTIRARIEAHLSERNVADKRHTQADRLVDAGDFVFDAPQTVAAVWGHGDEVLWARGESLIIGGPTGIGKTTVVQQIVLAGIGIRPAKLLGYPVQPMRRVLYLAMDRPQQVRRSLRRMLTPDHRATLSEKLAIWKGPPPADVAAQPRCLLQLAERANADVVVIDSLKDTAVGIAKDDIGAGVNTALQHLLAADIEVLALHHVRKSEQGRRTEPTTTDEFYGSTWITAGSGSILSLWGEAGDLIVSARHLKQPGAELGPWRLRHDHVHGTTEIDHGIDVLELIRYQRAKGLTPTALAYSLFPKDNDKRPTKNEIEKARRRLESLAEAGLAVKNDAARAGRGQEAAYFLAADETEELP